MLMLLCVFNGNIFGLIRIPIVAASKWNFTNCVMFMVMTGQKESSYVMMSSVAVEWQGGVVEVRAEGQSLMEASTGLVNENMNDIAAVIERKILCIKYFLICCITLFIE